MISQKTLVSLVAIFALAISLIACASASGSVSVEVSGVETDDLAVFAGQTIPVRVVFSSTENATDVRVKAWISGEKEYAVSSDRFDMVADKTYSKLVSVQVPSRVDPSEDLKLEVLIESRNAGTIAEEEVSLSAQRESYALDVLDAIMDSEVKAGSTLAMDIVLKNVGRQLSEDTFVKVRIPALGIEKKAYFGDLSAVDQADPDKEDAAERRITLSIPSNAPTGLYLVELEAYTADSTITATKKVSIIGGAAQDSVFVASANSKTFAVGEKATYSLTLVNSGDRIRVYELVPETSSTLAVDLSEQAVIVPAGQSKTVTFDATASKEGKYNFAVNIYSDGELVKKSTFLADVEGKSAKGFAGSATVVLTVILAIIFVVLLVVLIVLLTRKPENKAEEFGESYY
jgi:hypothetical protein